MLLAIAVVVIVLWLIGFVISNTLGGFVHVLLVIALGTFPDLYSVFLLDIFAAKPFSKGPLDRGRRTPPRSGTWQHDLS